MVPHLMTFNQAVEGFELASRARHLSPNTIRDYLNTLHKFSRFMISDPPVAGISADQVVAFLAGLDLSNKTILNHHVGMSAFWEWAVTAGLASTNILHQVKRPRPAQHIIQPFTEVEVRALINAMVYTSTYDRPGKRPTRNKLPDADRNQAMLLVLLDTGVRASELVDLAIHNVDLRSPNKSIVVRGGKGNKDRSIPISARTGQAIWKYLTSRRDARGNDPLFATGTGRKMDRTQLGKSIAAAGKRSGVDNAHPHRFRHTFAIFFLRNGGDIFTLQQILGHTTLDMVRIYLQIAQTDVDAAHRKASPVDNMRL